MKKLTLCIMIFLICSLCTSCSDSCVSKVKDVKLDRITAPPERTEELEGAVARDLSSFTEEEKAVISFADAVMSEKFGVLDLSDYKIEMHLESDDSGYVEYVLHIFTYPTSQSYRIRFDKDKNVIADNSEALNESEFSVFLYTASADALARAEEALKQSGIEYREGTKKFGTLQVSEGALYLVHESIEEKLGGSHVHVFRRAKVAHIPQE